MPAIARDGDYCGGEEAGGAITATAETAMVNGLAPVRIGDPVEWHGEPPHAAATMVEGSETVFFEGIGVCRVGDAASCGHTIEEGDASADTFAG